MAALRQATLMFLIDGNKVLLAMKKRGFGEGKWNGVGGKPNEGETIEQAAIRETEEEIGVKVKNLEQVGTLDFYFPAVPKEKDWNQQVVVFFAKEWDGEPVETEEMKPEWFDRESLPFDEMWVDDKIWLPKVLKGKKIKAEFTFDKDQNIEFYELEDSSS